MAAKRDHQAMERRRERAAALFASGHCAAEVARRLGVGRQSAARWKTLWTQGGRPALGSKGQAGRKARLSAAARQQVAAALVAGPLAQGYRTNLWTLPRVALLIKDLCGVSYHPGHVWYLLRALGFSCQRPERRAIERDEVKIAHWKRVTWPALKKRPGKRGAPSSSSTKAA